MRIRVAMIAAEYKYAHSVSSICGDNVNTIVENFESNPYTKRSCAIVNIKDKRVSGKGLKRARRAPFYRFASHRNL